MYWVHVAASFAMPLSRCAWRTRLWAGRRLRCSSCSGAAASARPRLCSRSDRASATTRRPFTHAAFANYALHGRPGGCRTSRANYATSGSKVPTHRRGVQRWQGHRACGQLARPRRPAFAASGRPVSAIVETLQRHAGTSASSSAHRGGVKAIPIESGVRDMLSALRKREGWRCWSISHC